LAIGLTWTFLIQKKRKKEKRKKLYVSVFTVCSLASNLPHTLIHFQSLVGNQEASGASLKIHTILSRTLTVQTIFVSTLSQVYSVFPK